MEHPVLEVNNLSLVLKSNEGPVELVKNVSFTLYPQQVLGLIGESGCGKSLTCLSIMGLLPDNIMQVEGEIRVNDQLIDIRKTKNHSKIRGNTIAMVLQNPMSCFDSVFKIKHHFKETLASQKKRNPKDYLNRSKDALLQVGFDNPNEILELYPFQMSGGMLQRVMVALALIMNASILIADEPTTDLDVVSQSRILDLLAEMRNRYGMSVLLVTHDLSVIAKLADKVAVMSGGSIVETATVENLFQKPGQQYTRDLLKAHLSLYNERLCKLLGFELDGDNCPVSLAN